MSEKGRGRASWLAVVVIATLTGARAAAAQDLFQSYRAALGYHYSTGDYGSSEKTDLVYVPLSVRGEIGRWSAQVTIPYLYINGPAGFINGPTGPIQTTNGRSSGLGDIFARGSYFLPSYQEWLPFAEFVAVVKFPTGSRSKGLGTGEFDFGADVELTWNISRFTPFATIGYRVLGSAPDIPLDNVWLGTLGLQYRVSEWCNAGVLVDYREAPSSTSGERVELVPFASFKARPHWSIDVYVARGFSDGSPDVGVGMQIGYAFAIF